MSPFTAEPASFRDPASTVFYAGGKVLRGLGDQASKDWETLSATAFFPRLLADGKVVGTKLADPAVLEDPALRERFTSVLEHERIPFVSYPYEWTFSMLKDAALLHLDVLLAALDEGMTMKDGYAYNVQWRGAAPAFIDVGSFERLKGSEPWAGYRQFCATFLYPLMLQAYKDVGFQPWLRAQIDGIEPSQMRGLFSSSRDKVRGGVLKHITLHSAMEARFKESSTQGVRKELEEAGFSKDLSVGMAKSLRKLIAGLDWERSSSTWSDYQETSTYSAGERETKARFVEEALAGPRLGEVWDLGGNDGTYSYIAARNADHVVLVDGDEVCIDAAYRHLRDEGNTQILPLVMNLADPSPGLGWRGKERTAFFDRSRPDAVLALALVHHLAISANVPLAEIVDWLWATGARVVVEFVHRDDPMSQRLLSNKPDGLFSDYRTEDFERLLADRFEIDRQETLPSGTRTLYAVRPRG
jgi:hypothetical protein